MKDQKIRIQILFDSLDYEFMKKIDEEYENKLNPSKIVALVFNKCRNLQRTSDLYEKECRRYEEKLKQIEYELRQKTKPKEAKE